MLASPAAFQQAWVKPGVDVVELILPNRGWLDSGELCFFLSLYE